MYNVELYCKKCVYMYVYMNNQLSIWLGYKCVGSDIISSQYQSTCHRYVMLTCGFAVNNVIVIQVLHSVSYSLKTNLWFPYNLQLSTEAKFEGWVQCQAKQKIDVTIAIQCSRVNELLKHQVHNESKRTFQHVGLRQLANCMSHSDCHLIKTHGSKSPVQMINLMLRQLINSTSRITPHGSEPLQDNSRSIYYEPPERRVRLPQSSSCCEVLKRSLPYMERYL